MLALLFWQCPHDGLEPVQPGVVVGDPLDRVSRLDQPVAARQPLFTGINRHNKLRS
jgi:hypothetical protein